MQRDEVQSTVRVSRKRAFAKKRESVAPAIIGPPSINLTIQGSSTGTRELTIDAPIPSPQYASFKVESHHLPRKAHAEGHEKKR